MVGEKARGVKLGPFMGARGVAAGMTPFTSLWTDGETGRVLPSALWLSYFLPGWPDYKGAHRLTDLLISPWTLLSDHMAGPKRRVHS